MAKKIVEQNNECCCNLLLKFQAGYTLKLKHGLLLHFLVNIKKECLKNSYCICRANGPIEYHWLQASAYQGLLVLSLLVLKRALLLYRMNTKIDFRRHIAQKVCNVLHNRELIGKLKSSNCPWHLIPHSKSFN